MKILITESQFDSMFLGKKVMVYYNLHKHTFSITYSGKLIMYADFVKLKDQWRAGVGGAKDSLLAQDRAVFATDHSGNSPAIGQFLKIALVNTRRPARDVVEA